MHTKHGDGQCCKENEEKQKNECCGGGCCSEDAKNITADTCATENEGTSCACCSDKESE